MNTKLTLFALTISVLVAPFAHRPVFLPFIAAGCQPSLPHEQSFAVQYEHTRFIVEPNPCSDQLRKRYFEISDTHPEGVYTDWSPVTISFTLYRTETWGDGHWRTVQRVEFRDFHYGFTVGAYRAGD